MTYSPIRIIETDPRVGDGRPDDQGEVVVYRTGDTATVLVKQSATDTDWAEMATSESSLFYNVLEYGLVADGITDNRAAFRSLVTTVLAAGGGRIYFPAAGSPYHFAIGGPGDRNILNITGSASAVVNARLWLDGDGMASCITWGGDAGGADSHFFYFRDGVKNLRVTNLYFKQKDPILNPDPAEQHHLFLVATSLFANTENVQFVGNYFGLIKGDVINVRGGLNKGAIVQAGIPANEPAGDVSEYIEDSTLEPQRLCVTYPASWDGGYITVTGTSLQDLVISEDFPVALSDTVTGTRVFKTVTAVAKSATGVLTTKTKVGAIFETKNVLVQGNYFNGFDYAGTNPDYGYRSCIGAQRLSSNIQIYDNFMTGSSDQIIDFEPTGNGETRYWRISRNIIISSNPKSGAQEGGLAVTLSGNGNNPAAGSNLNEMSVFSDNFVVGRIKGDKWDRVQVTGNTILDVINTASATGVLTSVGTNKNVTVSRNIIYCRPETLGRPLHIDSSEGYVPDGVKVEDNVIRWYGEGSAINIVGNHLQCNRNHVIYAGSDVDEFYGINIGPSEGESSDITISDNIIEGDAGTGSLDYGIIFQPSGTVSNDRLRISGNRGTGCTTRGISITNGIYGNPPTVYGNDFPDATTPLFLGSTVAVACGGNGGEFSLYRGQAASPNDLTILDSAAIGSLYSGQNGECLYRKNAAGANGWLSSFPSTTDLAGCVMAYATAATVTIGAGTATDVNGLGCLHVASTKTANITTSGANGLDTGTEASNTWYSVWVIGKLDGTTAALLSTSATSPVMPSGYVLKRRVGWVKNNGSSNFLKFYQQLISIMTRRILYDEDQSVLTVLSLGSAGSFTDVDLASLVPSTSIHAVLAIDLIGAGGGGVDSVQLRPNGATATDGPYCVYANHTIAGTIRGNFPVRTDSSQIIEYRVTDTNDDATILVIGYDDTL
jgi:hypothetical protein